MRRIRRDENHEDFIKDLTSGDGATFKDLWRVMLFAAILGFRIRRRSPLSSFDSGKAMPESYFANSPAWPGVLYLLGLVESRDTAVMGSKPEEQEVLLTTFEEYANGGLFYLRERLDEGQDRLKTLLDIIHEHSENIDHGEPDLKSVTI